jgi:PIF1-like helicase
VEVQRIFLSIDNNNKESIYSNCSHNEKKKLDDAAMYYLTLTSPWTLQKNKNKKTINELVPKAGHTYHHFIAYMKERKSYNEEKNEYNAPFLHRCLYSYIVDTSRNMRSKITNKFMSAKFRARSTDKWDDNHKGPSTYPKKQTECQSINYWRHKHKCDKNKNLQSVPNNVNEIHDMEEDIEGETRDLMKALQKENLKISKKNEDEKEGLQHNLEHTLKSICNITNSSKQSKKIFFNACIPNELSTTMWEVILDKHNTVPTPTNNEHELLPMQPYKINCNDLLSNTVPKIINDIIKPTNDQLFALSQLDNYLQTNEQFLIFIHGGPGVGKTWTINQFKNKMENLNKKHISTAYTGVAASLLSGGETIHSLFHIPVGKKAEFYVNNTLHDKALRNLHEMFFDCYCIMIDEISMVGSAMFYKISNRLQDVMNNTEPFGGKNIVVLGDLFQIIPVGDSSLFTILPLQ